jgi:heme/copper-type cytochrome/quinol oxidase subunit 2
MFISTAYASNLGINVAVGFLEKLNDIILFPLIALMMAVAIVVFLYGCFEYVIYADNQSARDTGRQHIMWGIVGLLIMVSAYAILRIAVGTFGLQNELNCANNPTAGGCETFRSPGGVTGGNTGVTGGNPGVRGSNP